MTHLAMLYLPKCSTISRYLLLKNYVTKSIVTINIVLSFVLKYCFSIKNIILILITVQPIENGVKLMLM